MFRIETPRLVIAAAPLDVLRRRLAEADFTMPSPLGEGVEEVYYPAEWPGDALVLFPMMIDSYDADAWTGTIIDRVEHVAVGMIGTKGQPDADGSIEIGYGINPAYWRRGYAGEGAGVFVEFLLAQPNVRRVTAETRTDNFASMRVLEKVGFTRIGTREDPEDGPLIIWQRA